VLARAGPAPGGRAAAGPPAVNDREDPGRVRLTLAAPPLSRQKTAGARVQAPAPQANVAAAGQAATGRAATAVPARAAPVQGAMAEAARAVRAVRAQASAAARPAPAATAGAAAQAPGETAGAADQATPVTAGAGEPSPGRSAIPAIPSRPRRTARWPRLSAAPAWSTTRATRPASRTVAPTARNVWRAAGAQRRSAKYPRVPQGYRPMVHVAPAHSSSGGPAAGAWPAPWGGAGTRPCR